MSRLHILNQSDDAAAAASELLRVLQAGDTVLLIENAVALGSAGHDFSASVSGIADTRLLALQADCDVRGQNVACEQIDYAGFVALTAACEQCISWF